MSKSPVNSSESGIILAVVLILLGIIIALVLHAQVLAHACLNLENKRLLRTQLRETASDGIQHALNVLAADADMMIDHTNEGWAAQTHIRLPNGIETEITIIDENRFIDANMLAFISASKLWRAPAAIVRDLLAGEEFPRPEQQTGIIQDWVVNQNSEGGHETYRRSAGQGTAANALMASTEELLWLLEATTNTAAMPTALTILPSPEARIEPVNVNTASRETLLAIFGKNNEGLVERIIRLRNESGLLTLAQVMDRSTLQRFAAYLSVRSSFFSVYAKAGTGTSAQAVYCLVKRDQTGNIKVIRWVEQ